MDALRRNTARLACLFSLALPQFAAAAEPGVITLASPQPYQVVQRVGYVPAEEGAAAKASDRGAATVSVVASLPEGVTAGELQFRLTLLDSQAAPDDPQDASVRPSADWSPLPTPQALSGPGFQFQLIVPAGGWYRLELQCQDLGSPRKLLGAVEPFGVGEVFLVAGQSYATNTNEERLSVSDSRQRVVALNTEKNSWAVANDPQPTADQSSDGSIWPAVGDALAAELEVPIAFANVAYGGTSSSQWLPDGGLHSRLRSAGQAVGRFRAVLWQQGESDVIAQTSTDQYVANLKQIRKAAARAWGFEPVWLLAKSTHHPTVYNDAAGEARIRDAIEQLSSLPGFGPGPDTDTLQGENRGGANSRRHFSAVGQQRAAQLWHQVLSQRLRLVPRGVEAASFLLADLHLLEPAWASETVVRESSVVLQQTPQGPGLARLAFPAAEIIQVARADRQFQFSLPQHCSLGNDGNLHFNHAPLQPDLDLSGFMFRAVDPIRLSDLWLPAGSPNSYRHRVGHPEQHLLYQPGRWFHDRNIEVTYRRDVSLEPLTNESVALGSLPKTMQRLRAGEPLTLGISGDSISTGLDASAMTTVPPFQPGYPELVVAQLQTLFDSEVDLKNRAVAGWSVANGVADLDALLAEQPHLIVVAYGMNDVGRRDPQWFGEQTRTIVQRVQAASPETELILVAPMLGNSEWIHTPREMFGLYRDELKSLIAPGVALADVTTVWELLLQRKHDVDLTGNGLNHPNDFGHRLYAQALLQLFK